MIPENGMNIHTSICLIGINSELAEAILFNAK
jgi:hypothetical protein